MNHTLRIPTKEQYAYIEVAFEGTPDEALVEYRRLTDLVQGVKGDFKEVVTFTGETILYDLVNHGYKTLDGKPLLSGSKYKKDLEAPFPPDQHIKTGDKYGMPPEDVQAMWSMNSYVSRNFGNAVHKGLEMYLKYQHHTNEKNYFLPNNKIVRQAVLAFPDLDSEGHSEIMVSDTKQGMVGQIDRLKVIGEKVGEIEDFKTDADIKKNLKGHFNQLSFYAHILRAFGWEIETLRIWNWDGAVWTKYESPVLELKLK